MISVKAKSLLRILVDKYHVTGKNVFDNTDYISITSHEKLLTELHNAGLLIYDEESIVGHVELTYDGISFKF